ncbi:MAG: hypothetical protein HYZ45_02675, partial [Burkholderiales bacterium]|nr:hypothetical protein [Burkholderiales bacterium]
MVIFLSYKKLNLSIVKKSFFQLVLSLMLLVSQQIGIAHAVGHLTQDLSKATAGAIDWVHPADICKIDDISATLDDSCDQCDAFEQISTALATDIPDLPAIFEQC